MARKHPSFTSGRLPPSRIIANTHASATGRDLIIVGSGRKGKIYLATSMPTRTEADCNNLIDLLEEALTKLKRMRQQHIDGIK